MTLPRALVLALAAHLVLAALPLPGGTAPVPTAAPANRALSLQLVAPTQTLGEAEMEPGAPADASSGGAAAASSAASTAADAGGATATPTGTAEAAPASLDSMALQLGLDLHDVSEPLLDRIFPVILKIHLQGGRPSASNYRQLLRTYIDVVMGYPWAVQAQLSANSQLRFLARFEVEVAADGSLRLDSLLLNADVADQDGRLLGYYQRALADAMSRPFVPPSRAGLQAPLRLSFQLLNPEARVW